MSIELLLKSCQKYDKDSNVIGDLIADENFDQHNDIFFEHNNIKVNIEFKHTCKKCGNILEFKWIMSGGIVGFNCRCGEYTGRAASKGYGMPHINLKYTPYSQGELFRSSTISPK